jgi:hypothetical protein
MIGNRGPAVFVLLMVALIALGGCQRKPVVARTAPPPAPPPAAAPVEEKEPVPVAAPRVPVETGGLEPPPPSPRSRPRS